MDQVLDFFRKLFDTADWPPRWHCGNWTQFHGWLYIISDLLIWSAYFAIPLIILKYVSKRVNARFVRGYFLFAAFILACGSTHFLDAVTFWFPAYRLNALVRLITGVVSWATVFYLIKIMPVASQLKTNEELEKEVEERKKAEEKLIFSNKQLNEAQAIAKLGSWQWDVKANKIYWSNELHKIYGINDGEDLAYEKFVQMIHPDDREMVNKNIEAAFQTKQFPDYVHRIVLADGTEKIMQARGEVICDVEGNVVRMIGTGQDVTQQQKAQQELLDKTQQLEQTNEELQRFAYVASHDLQEPLRKILTFSSLLEKEQLSDKANEYASKMVNASQRMQRLIDDILQFSSLRSENLVFEKTDLHKVLKNVLSDIEVSIQNANAQIIIKGDLPEIEAIPSQIGQLFQNILSNAIKFAKDNQSPHVIIDVQKLNGSELRETIAPIEKPKELFWQHEQFVKMVINDDGIGFDSSYAEKIFEVFQRLHNRKMYEGTGIGLAICKRIVDNHHGYIKAESNLGDGARFIIILPVTQKNFI